MVTARAVVGTRSVCHLAMDSMKSAAPSTAASVPMTSTCRRSSSSSPTRAFMARVRRTIPSAPAAMRVPPGAVRHRIGRREWFGPWMGLSGRWNALYAVVSMQVRLGGGGVHGGVPDHRAKGEGATAPVIARLLQRSGAADTKARLPGTSPPEPPGPAIHSSARQPDRFRPVRARGQARRNRAASPSATARPRRVGRSAPASQRTSPSSDRVAISR